MDHNLATDEDLDISAPRRTKVGVAALVTVIMLVIAAGVIRIFTPDFAARVVETVLNTFSVTVTTPPMDKPPPPPKAPDEAGKSGNEGKKAVPREAVKPPINKPIKQAPAPINGGKGSANTSGASQTGSGTGAGGPGNGPGNGAGGNGTGGGAVTKAVKIAGDINSARDYPIASRDLRINDFVIVAITVGVDGTPTGCRVARPSKDAQANAITCQLALKRFRFRPATDTNGKPIASVFGWKQSWYY
ncbi:MAG: energy transducer TonB [Novosphingobium sp.]